ncbi:F0F1 ATP synthase subunit B [Roseicyclus persicicus]|uniref:ATP synthase subunit b n=1 Tax=Roseicyclus persicicus TaxID=2650661 RepID=A0A7X6GVY9_9RHOB|nr:F0F1 ATP synthase subunit B [Roseibacterium persicicum]NKX43323.1 F0F1 ATP synthase subunit B [Roseibacterium persicicum]
MRKLMIPALLLAAGPALAAEPGYTPGYDFTSLFNTDFVVLIGFLVFLSVLFYFNVPAMLGGLLDKRAEGIKAELDEARALREEAQTLLASYERKSREVADQADRIVAQAKADAEAAAVEARAALEKSIARRLQAAEDQIASAEQKAVRSVRDRAVEVAIAAAAEAIAKKMAAADANRLIDDAIGEVERRLH